MFSCSHKGMDSRLISPNLENSAPFQAKFGRKIKEQGWLENGLRVQSGLVCGVMFIEKGSPNPMRDINEYANPNEK